MKYFDKCKWHQIKICSAKELEIELVQIEQKENHKSKWSTEKDVSANRMRNGISGSANRIGWKGVVWNN